MGFNVSKVTSAWEANRLRLYTIAAAHFDDDVASSAQQVDRFVANAVHAAERIRHAIPPGRFVDDDARVLAQLATVTGMEWLREASPDEWHRAKVAIEESTQAALDQ